MGKQLKSFLGFFTDIGNFFKGHTVLGVDIGTSFIKIVEVSESRGKFSLQNYGILEKRASLEHQNQAIQTSSLKIEEKEVATILHALLKDMKPKTNIAICSIPPFASFITLIDLPLMSESETKQAIQFQAHRYIPFKLSDVLFDWMKVGEFDGERGGKIQRIMLIVIPNDIIAKYKKIFEWAGLKLEALEMESLALIRSVIKPEEGVIMAVDFGAESTAITIADNSRLEFVNQIDYGGSYLTKAISRSLELSERRAEELKKSRGLLARGADSELSTLTLPFLDVIIREVERTKETYEKKYKKSIQKVMCVGGGANLLGLEEYVGKQLHLPVIQAKPLVGVEYPLQIEPIVHQLQNNFAVSIGLAKRYYIQ